MEIINNIQENNKLIAEFMGLTIITDGISWFDTNYKPLAKYNEFWNDLMPVVKKIETLNINGHHPSVVIGSLFNILVWDREKSQYKYIVSLSETSGDKLNKTSRIENTYKGIIEFIKWYNKNKENGNKD